MPDTTLTGLTTPSQPNFGLTVFDVDYAPEQFAGPPADVGGDFGLDPNLQGPVLSVHPVAGGAGAPLPIKLQASTGTAADLRAIFNVPLDVSGAAVTNLGAKLGTGTPTVSNTPNQGTLIQSITRFLRRISKLNRGTN